MNEAKFDHLTLEERVEYLQGVIESATRQLGPALAQLHRARVKATIAAWPEWKQNVNIGPQPVKPAPKKLFKLNDVRTLRPIKLLSNLMSGERYAYRTNQGRYVVAEIQHGSSRQIVDNIPLDKVASILVQGTRLPHLENHE